MHLFPFSVSKFNRRSSDFTIAMTALRRFDSDSFPMTMQAASAAKKKLLRRNLSAMNADGFSFSVMVGIGETYLPAFVLARGMGELTAAMIATVPILLGSLLQLTAPLILQRVRSYRRFVVGTACLQACSLLVLVGMAFADHVPIWAVFAPATVYWAAGLATGPAWNTWVEQIVPRRIRPGFFARRSRMCHIGVLIGLISGGVMLRWSDSMGIPVTVFAILFGIGSIGRFLSAVMLARQSETPERAVAGASSPETILLRDRFSTMFRTMRSPGPIGRFVFFLMAVQTAVHISGPYFNPFMLKAMNLSSVDYMCLLSLGFIGKMLSLPWAARIANTAGADKLLWIGSLGIIPMSALWTINQSVWFLACVQLLSGMVWGCYELAMLLQFFRQIPSHRRVGILTLYNLGNSSAMVAGSLIGAAILKSLGGRFDAYLAVFMASSMCRCAALLLLPGGRTAVASTRLAVNGWISRTIAVRPMGSMERPIFAVMDSAADDSDQVLVPSGAPAAVTLANTSPRFQSGGVAATRKQHTDKTQVTETIGRSA